MVIDNILPKNFISASAEKYPDKTALVFGSVELSYSKLDDLVKKAASELASRNIKQGDYLVLAMGNCIEFFVFLFASLNIGAIAFPVSPKLTEPEIKLLLGGLKADFFICNTAEIFPQDKDLRLKIGQGLVVSYDGWEIVYKNSLDNTSSFVTLNDGLATDNAMVMMSSGTTGVPKLMFLSTEYLFYSVDSIIDSYKADVNDVFLSIIPPQHIMGLAPALTAFYSGATLVLIDEFVPQLILAEMQKYKASFLPISPFGLGILTQAAAGAKTEILSPRLIVSGGSPLSPDLYQKATAVFKTPISEAYGSIEVCLAACRNVDHKYEPGVVGKISVNSSIKILDDKKNELPLGQVGDILVSGPTVIKGYINNSLANEESFVGDSILIGDRGFLDSDNKLHLVGRTKDVIDVAGVKVDPTEVEIVLASHPKVKEVAVYGVKKDNTEIVKAAVVVDSEVNVSELQEFCRLKLSDYKVPKDIKFIPAIPRNKMGKILRHELQAYGRTSKQ